MTKRIFRKKNQEKQKFSDLILKGSSFIGIPTMSGAIIGSVLTPGVGTAVGAAVGAGIGRTADSILKNIIEKRGNEIYDLNYGEREFLRMAGVISIIHKKVKSNLENGKTLRGDGFFDFDKYGRTPAEQIIEAVTLLAKEEYREDKIEYYGNLYANLLFGEAVSREAAHHMIKISGDLSYNQMAIIAFFYKHKDNLSEPFEIDTRQYLLKSEYIYANEGTEPNLDFNTFSSELKQLSDYEIFGMQGYPHNYNNVPRNMNFTPLGRNLSELMELSYFDDTYFKKFIDYIANPVMTMTI